MPSPKAGAKRYGSTRRRWRRSMALLSRRSTPPGMAPMPDSESPQALSVPRRSRLQFACWGVTAVLSLMLLAAIEGAFGDLMRMQGRVHAAQSELDAVAAQQKVGRVRLAALESRQGREAVLLEHGYVKPGERILLFPSGTDDDAQSEVGRNDLVRQKSPDQLDVPPAEPRPSVWRRGGRVLSGWWRTVRGKL